MKTAWNRQEHWQKMKGSSGENFQERWHLDRVTIEAGNPVFMMADREPWQGDAVSRAPDEA